MCNEYQRPRSYADAAPAAVVPQRDLKEFGSSGVGATEPKYTTTSQGKSYRYEPDNTNLLLVPSALKDTKKSR